jgi:hypothetical protein
VVGYTFDMAWKPRVAAEYYFASGDEGPVNNSFDRYESLFGARRSDLGHTGIYGPFVPSNIVAPGFRVEVKPTDFLDARFTYKSVSLDSADDAWVAAGTRDTLGQSGTAIGDAFEARVRYWVVKDSLRAELGGATLIRGDFAQNAPGSTQTGDPQYGYFMLTKTF